MTTTPSIAPLATLLRRSGALVECDVAGSSMGSAVPHGSTVRIRCDGTAGAGPGAVMAIVLAGTLSIHRLKYVGRSARARGWFVTHGDNNFTCDAPVPCAGIVGRVEAIRRASRAEWEQPGPPMQHGPLRTALTSTVQAVIAALLEVHPRAARAAKGLVVLAMLPLVWLRPYGPGRVRSASVAHRTGA